MALTDDQENRLIDLAKRARQFQSQCVEGIVRQEEAHTEFAAIRDAILAIPVHDSREWRLLDKDLKAINPWWDVQSSGYLSGDPGGRFETLATIIAHVVGAGGQSAPSRPASMTRPGLAPRGEEPDERMVFLCHAGEDRPGFVEPLVEALAAVGISYWYSEEEILWGDSLVETINTGLRKSRYVVVLISVASIGKKWPEAELFSAIETEIQGGGSKVLPLLLGSPAETSGLADRYPLLRGKRYLTWSGGSPATVIEELRALIARES